MGEPENNMSDPGVSLAHLWFYRTVLTRPGTQTKIINKTVSLIQGQFCLVTSTDFVRSEKSRCQRDSN